MRCKNKDETYVLSFDLAWLICSLFNALISHGGFKLFNCNLLEKIP